MPKELFFDVADGMEESPPSVCQTEDRRSPNFYGRTSINGTRLPGVGGAPLPQGRASVSQSTFSETNSGAIRQRRYEKETLSL